MFIMFIFQMFMFYMCMVSFVCEFIYPHKHHTVKHTCLPLATAVQQQSKQAIYFHLWTIWSYFYWVVYFNSL